MFNYNNRDENRIDSVKELEQLSRSWHGKVGLYGAGIIGSTWGYDIITAAGFKVSFYVDRNAAKILERNYVKCIGFEELRQYDRDNTLIFITASTSSQEDIRDELINQGFKYNLFIDFIFLERIILDITNYNDPVLLSKYNCIIDDVRFIQRRFKYQFGRGVNFQSPKTFNEKIQWLKIHDHNPFYTILADKYEVKKIVASTVGEEYLIKTIGVYNTFEEIDFKNMPEQFVLKCTHDCGSIIICKNKEEFDFEKSRMKINLSLKSNFYWRGREWAYKGIKPRIIVEEYIEDKVCGDLMDYKIFCFEGKAKWIQVDYDRHWDHKRNIYDLNWNHLPMSIMYPTSDKTIERPQCFENMIWVAEKLSEGIPHVRVDLYAVHNKDNNGDIYQKCLFGEMTFYHGNGYEQFTPKEMAMEFGDMIDISKAWDYQE